MVTLATIREKRSRWEEMGKKSKKPRLHIQVRKVLEIKININYISEPVSQA